MQSPLSSITLRRQKTNSDMAETDAPSATFAVEKMARLSSYLSSNPPSDERTATSPLNQKNWCCWRCGLPC